MRSRKTASASDYGQAASCCMATTLRPGRSTAEWRLHCVECAASFVLLTSHFASNTTKPTSNKRLRSTAYACPTSPTRMFQVSVLLRLDIEPPVYPDPLKQSKKSMHTKPPNPTTIAIRSIRAAPSRSRSAAMLLAFVMTVILSSATATVAMDMVASEPRVHSLTTAEDACFLNSVKIDPPTYVVGEAGVDDSVIAVCEDAALKCYRLSSVSPSVDARIPQTLEVDCHEAVESQRRLQDKKTSKERTPGTRGDTSAASSATSIKASPPAKPVRVPSTAPIKMATRDSEAGKGSVRAATTGKSTSASGPQRHKDTSSPTTQKEPPSKRDSVTANAPSQSQSMKQKATSKTATDKRTKSTTATTASTTTNNKSKRTVQSPRVHKTATMTKSRHKVTNTTHLDTSKPICMHKGTRIRGVHHVRDETGWFYMICNELARPPTLTCYKDGRVADTSRPDPEVPCEKVPAVSALDEVTKNQRRLMRTRNEDSITWPYGYVCYSMARYAEDLGTRRSEAEMLRFAKFENDIYDLVHDAMDEYSMKVGIVFILEDSCKEKLEANPGVDICGGCESVLEITFNSEAEEDLHENECFSHIGYQGPSKLHRLNLGANCWEPAIVLHQIGHALGLSHQHQHPDRLVLVDKFEAGAYNKKKSLKVAANYATKYGIDFFGSPDPQSIMHYHSDFGICIRNEEFRHERFCDVLEDPKHTGCTQPVPFIHCDTTLDLAFGRGQHLSVGDISRLMEMYGTEIRLRGNLKTSPPPTS